MRSVLSLLFYIRYGRANLGFVSHSMMPGTMYRYSAAELKGRRPYMEDKLVVFPKVSGSSASLYCVCDGHGGAEASQYVVGKLRDVLDKQLREDTLWNDSLQDSSQKLKNSSLDKFNFKSILVNTFKTLDIDFLKIAKSGFLNAGTTALCAIATQTHVTVANTGDSRALLVKKNGKTLPLSIDHKPNNLSERERITKLGGTVVFWGVWRVQGVLAVSRAIGDRLLKPYVIPDPDVIQHQVSSEDAYVVLATDGLWDVLSHVDVEKCLQMCTDYTMAAEFLVKTAYAKGSQDNVSAIVIYLNEEHNKPLDNEDL